MTRSLFIVIQVHPTKSFRLPVTFLAVAYLHYANYEGSVRFPTSTKYNYLSIGQIEEGPEPCND